MADPGFSRGGGANSKGYYLAITSRKLHGIERIWTPPRSANALIGIMQMSFFVKYIDVILLVSKLFTTVASSEIRKIVSFLRKKCVCIHIVTETF